MFPNVTSFILHPQTRVGGDRTGFLNVVQKSEVTNLALFSAVLCKSQNWIERNRNPLDRQTIYAIISMKK